MFDIFVYLFENFPHAGQCPDESTLARRLSAAGFDSDHIERTLDWLKELDDQLQDAAPALGSSRALRCFDNQETIRISPEGRGFLLFLERAGFVTPPEREQIIDRVLALNETSPSVRKIKLVALMVLWKGRPVLDALVLDELLLEGPRVLH